MSRRQLPTTRDEIDIAFARERLLVARARRRLVQFELAERVVVLLLVVAAAVLAAAGVAVGAGAAAGLASGLAVGARFVRAPGGRRDELPHAVPSEEQGSADP